MKIALCVEGFDPGRGGQGVWTHGFATHLLARGHDVHVVSCAFGSDGLGIHRNPVPWHWSPLVRARRFQTALREIGADAVYDASTTIWPGVWHPHSGSELHALDRLIATEPPARRMRAAISPKMLLLRTQMAWIEARQARRALAIVAVSDLVKALLRQRHPSAGMRIETIPNGTDTDFFVPPALGRDTSKATGEIVFLLAAHNPVLKGLDIALQAFSVLVQEGHAIRLVVAGVEHVDPWNRMAERLGVRERMSFSGLVGDMRPIYAQADVLLHPTRWDACSLVVLEAMACGLPVVTTAVNGAAGMIVSGTSGLVLPVPEDVPGLAAAMRMLLDSKIRQTMGRAARAAIEGHDIRANYRSVESVLVRIADGAEHGGR